MRCKQHVVEVVLELHRERRAPVRHIEEDARQGHHDRGGNAEQRGGERQRHAGQRLRQPPGQALRDVGDPRRAARHQRAKLSDRQRQAGERSEQAQDDRQARRRLHETLAGEQATELGLDVVLDDGLGVDIAAVLLGRRLQLMRDLVQDRRLKHRRYLPAVATNVRAQGPITAADVTGHQQRHDHQDDDGRHHDVSAEPDHRQASQ